MRRAITLLEVLIVISIVTLLAGLMFLASAPAREAARERSCMGNLRQVYVAWSLYSADWPTESLHPAMGEMSLVPQPIANKLWSYANEHDVWICPSTPGYLRQKYATTFMLYFATPAYAAEKAARISELERLGSLAPAAVCRIHEETYYQNRRPPREEMTVGSHLLSLRYDGSIVVWLKPEKRIKRFTGDI